MTYSVRWSMVGLPVTEWWPGGEWAIAIALNCRNDLPSVTLLNNICLDTHGHTHTHTDTHTHTRCIKEIWNIRWLLGCIMWWLLWPVDPNKILLFFFYLIFFYVWSTYFIITYYYLLLILYSLFSSSLCTVQRNSPFLLSLWSFFQMFVSDKEKPWTLINPMGYKGC